jgi:PDZ domain-containing secreted protein
MSSGQRWAIGALAGMGVLLCIWCSLISGIGGWAIGSDIAARAERANAAATATASADLPPLGVLITRTERDGPAARAGIARGDIITAVNGVQVQDAKDLSDTLRRYHPKQTVSLTVSRERSDLELPVELGAFPDDNLRPYIGIYFTARAEEPADL